MNRVCVFCGSSVGTKPVYADAARAMGSLLASRGIGLVYGGGHVGLMGVVANVALEAGGEVIGRRLPAPTRAGPQSVPTSYPRHPGRGRYRELACHPGRNPRTPRIG